MLVHTVWKRKREPRWKERVTDGGTERQQKPVNPSIGFLLGFWRSQTARDYTGRSLAPSSCCSVPPELVREMNRLKGSGAAWREGTVFLSLTSQQKRTQEKSKIKILHNGWMLWAKIRQKQEEKQVKKKLQRLFIYWYYEYIKYKSHTRYTSHYLVPVKEFAHCTHLQPCSIIEAPECQKYNI